MPSILAPAPRAAIVPAAKRHPLRTDPDAGHRLPAGNLELVDNEAMAAALDARWRPRPCRGPGLLLIDPAGLWAGAIVKALSDTTGARPQRVRVLSPAGFREAATIDELHLPPLPGRPSVVRHLRTRRLNASTLSPALERLWHHTAHVALLVGSLPPDDMGRWLVNASALASRLGDPGPRWSMFMPAGTHRKDVDTDAPRWMRRMQFLPQPGAADRLPSASAVWNAVFRAWVENAGMTGWRDGA